MVFNEGNLNLFLDDKPFYENENCFCLGNTMTEAGEVIKEIICSLAVKGENVNVELDI